MKVIFSVFLVTIVLLAGCTTDKTPLGDGGDDDVGSDLVTISEPRLVVDGGRSCEVSPDGQRIAFSLFSGSSLDIHTATTGGEDVQRITTADASEDHPFWSPDGSTLGFSSDLGGDQRYHIYSVSLDSREITQVTPDSFGVQSGHWSPDGQWIVFDGSSETVPSNALSIIDVTSGEITTHILDLAYAGWPKVSPDGERIVFEALVEGSAEYNIWTVKTDGTELQQITTTGGEYPCWSPDGRWIAYSRMEPDDNYDLYLTESDGRGLPHPVTHTPTTNEVRVCWSPDGTSLYYDTRMGTATVTPENPGIYAVTVEIKE
jgi:Tol biopolymer transport system component